MKLDRTVLADLAVAFTPKDYVRVTPMAHAATPLAAGYGQSRFASPIRAFKVVYLAEDLTTSIAETLVRDRFQGKARRTLLLNSRYTNSKPLNIADQQDPAVPSNERSAGEVVGYSASCRPASPQCEPSRDLGEEAETHYG